MELIKQTGETCLPCVFAMLEGDTEMGMIKKLLGPDGTVEQWNYLSRPVRYDDQAGIEEMNKFGREILRPFTEKNFPWIGMEVLIGIYDSESVTRALSFGSRYPEVKPGVAPQGTGIMTLISRLGGRHIVVFDRGIVYDSSLHNLTRGLFTEPMDWEFYWQLQASVRIMYPEDLRWKPQEEEVRNAA